MKGIYILIYSFLYLGGIGNAQYTKLLDFSGSNGANPSGDLIYDGIFLYGITQNGGTNGVIFKIKPDGSGYSKLFDFDATTIGGAHGSLISDGTFFYGMTAQSIFKIKPDGTGYFKLLDFIGANGLDPLGSLISDGTFLYGMTREGGTNICDQYGSGCGVIFKIKTDGTGYSKLHDFSLANGSGPRGALIYEGGFLYGTTWEGGANCEPHGCGVIFKIKPDGTGYSDLYDFDGTISGAGPVGSLISDGTFLYGMTMGGGLNGPGTIFKIKPDGTGFSKLLDFSGTANGSHPIGSLIYDGTFLYGMTREGGTSTNCGSGCGVIFKIKPDGTGYSKLLDFTSANGSDPMGSLISDGAFLYGMTRTGGTNNMGVIFSFRAGTTGINETDASASLSMTVYPNPAKNTITIKFASADTPKIATLKINNSLGATVYSEVVKENTNSFTKEINGSTSLTINVVALPKGVYFVELLQGSNCSVQKFVLQ